MTAATTSGSSPSTRSEDKQSYKTLKTGWAWVQFCLFDDTTPKGNGTTDFGEPVSSMLWKYVH